jgi:hypothetical protein
LEKECREISRGNGHGTGEKEKKETSARTSILICINPHSSTGMILLNAVERKEGEGGVYFPI